MLYRGCVPGTGARSNAVPEIKPEPLVDLVEEIEGVNARGNQLMERLGQCAMASLVVFDRGDDAVCDHDAQDSRRPRREPVARRRRLAARRNTLTTTERQSASAIDHGPGPERGRKPVTNRHGGHGRRDEH